MSTTFPGASTLVDVLCDRTETHGASLLYRFLLNGEVDGPSLELTYRALDLRARAVAAKLTEAHGHGQRALMLYPAGLDFMVGFFGCLYAGTIAVPAYPPDAERLDRTLARLKNIASDCKARFVVTTSAIKKLAREMLAGVPELAALTWIATDEIDLALASGWNRPAIDGSGVAFLQYTSGSTGDPKGVVVTHENLIQNERAISRAFGDGAARDHVSWLPLYHDMGLIGKALHAPFAGTACTFFSPLDFLKRPARWLRAISRFRAGFSAAPNFAYDLCARKIDDRDIAGIDLSSWQAAVNAAEPVRQATLDRFATRFARHGFRRESFAPAYGLAEATLFVTAGSASEAPRVFAVSGRALEQGVVAEPESAADARTYVSCGHAWDDHAVRIVDPDSLAPCDAGRIGEIWVSGPSVGGGYWNRPEESSRTFRASAAGSAHEGSAGPFLRTGDLGFIRDGELLVTGRLKDLVILRGRNHLPNDIEHTVERAHAAVRSGCSAAFAVDEGGEERLVVVAELEPSAIDDASAAAAAVRRAVAEAHDVSLHTLVFIEARTIPKTTSGKIQRRATRAAWIADRLPVVATFVQPSGPVAADDPSAMARRGGARGEPARRAARDPRPVRSRGGRASASSAERVDRRRYVAAKGGARLARRRGAARAARSGGRRAAPPIDRGSITDPADAGEALLASWLGARVTRSPSDSVASAGRGEKEVF